VAAPSSGVSVIGWLHLRNVPYSDWVSQVMKEGMRLRTCTTDLSPNRTRKVVFYRFLALHKTGPMTFSAITA
jgi:hypothetical protein